MSSLIQAWNRGYESTGYRSLQSVGLFIIQVGTIAALIAATLAICCHYHGLDFNRQLMQLINDGRFQAVGGVVALALATSMFYRARYPELKPIEKE